VEQSGELCRKTFCNFDIHTSILQQPCCGKTGSMLDKMGDKWYVYFIKGGYTNDTK